MCTLLHDAVNLVMLLSMHWFLQQVCHQAQSLSRRLRLNDSQGDIGRAAGMFLLSLGVSSLMSVKTVLCTNVPTRSLNEQHPEGCVCRDPHLRLLVVCSETLTGEDES